MITTAPLGAPVSEGLQMPARKGPNAGLSMGWSPGEDYWGGPMNDNLLYMDTLFCLWIRSASRATPPADAKNGDIHIVASGAADEWANADGLITVRDDDKWTFYTPKRGMRGFLQSTNRFIFYDGEKWLNEGDNSSAENPTPENKPKQYHISMTIPYQPNDKEPLLIMPVVQVIQMPKGATGSAATTINPSPGYVKIVMLRNGSQFGFIEFEKGNNTGTFTLPATTTLTVGDVLEVVAPDESVQDFKDFGVTLVFDTLNG